MSGAGDPALHEGCEDALHGVEPRDQVRDRQADPHRRSVGGAGEPHDPAHRLHDGVVTTSGVVRLRAVAAVAADGTGDQARVALAQL